MTLRVLVVLVLLGSGCANPPVRMNSAAEAVQVGRSDPADNFSLLGPVTAQDGSGCGGFGRRGTYDNAIVALRVKGAAMGANYVSITRIREPYLANPNCFENAYIISGMAYRRVSAAPSPIPIRDVDSPGQDSDLVEELAELHRLHQAGALSDAEYERAKARLLE